MVKYTILSNGRGGGNENIIPRKILMLENENVQLDI